MVGQVTGLKNRERLRSDVHREPTADRGPQRGSPAGVVDAPDAKLNLTSSGANVRYFREPHPRLTLAAGATALGSVIGPLQTKKPLHLKQRDGTVTMAVSPFDGANRIRFKGSHS